MSAFDIAMNTLFTDSNIRATAVYSSMHGKNKKVNVIVYHPDAFINVADSFVVSSALVLEVLVADCPKISPGDKFMIQDKLYTVQGEPKHSNDSLIWRIDLV
jgi:hypothetical protein